ncbi:MAG: hypothetical protein US18_C0027G0017 [Parcubacteria group bacterium GW2011_GWB1_36_5]|nr:MAG: hypothetical protein US18_C0027G0017 [Parcubacteria group bacterium GW2011_GWB1_36_5]
MDYQDLENRIKKLEKKIFTLYCLLGGFILGAFFSSEIEKILKIAWDIFLGLIFYFLNKL